MKLTKLLLWSGMLTSLGMLTSCANDDLGKGRQTDGDKGVAVTFNVSDVRDKANNATSPDGAVTRAAFAERLVVQNLTPEDLTSRKLSIVGADDACLIETTVAGVPSTRTNGKAQTRANITTTATLGNFSSIGYRGTASGNLETTPWFYNEETDSNGELSTPKQWSWGKRYGKFFAVAPQVTADYSKLTLSPQSHTSTPYVNFEVEPDVKNQKDLMTACSGEVHYAVQGTAPTTNLTFRHALTAIRFKVGQNLSWNKTISKVEIINAKSKGRYTLPTDAAGTDAGWTDLNDPQTFTLDGISVSTSEAVNNIIMGKDNDNYVFYMIPQPLSGVSVKIYFADGSTPITANLSGKWKPGTTKTYALSEDTSNWDYQLHVTSPAAVDYNVTTTDSYTIQSYREDPATHTQQPVAWKVVGYDKDGDGVFDMSEKPDWLTSISKSEGNGGMVAETGSATLTTSFTDLLAARNTALKTASALGSSGNYYDLSTKGGTVARNTANCYVISAPGYYRIPLVYGNAITNGNTNEHAFETTVSSGYVLQNFKDHTGHNISAPWITLSNSGANVPNGARIVWADESELVADLELEGSGTNAFVHFRVPQEKIKNGNVVIAVTKGYTVVWSWHLWFAPQDVLNTIACTNFTNYVYKFTHETLGWKYTDWIATAYDKPRSVKIKVEQTIANGGVKQEGIITIKQKDYRKRQGYSTLYQWGRKDAMPGTDAIADGRFEKDGGNKMSIKNSIRHPETFYLRGSGWSSDYNYYNLWSMDNATEGYNDDSVVKTVYDPCPAGFHMPASNAFTGFTKNGENGGPMNVSGAWDNGWNFNNKITSPDATVYFPASGDRGENGGILDDVGQRGYYWSAVRHSGGDYGCVLNFSSLSYVSVHSNFGRPLGFAVRPVAE